MTEMNKPWQLTEHFTKEEFVCQCGCGNGDIKISERLVHELEVVRVHYGKPMRANSVLLQLPTHAPISH
jgi:hypothetical protein